MESIPHDQSSDLEVLLASVEQCPAAFSDQVRQLAGEVDRLRKIVRAAPTVEHLRDLIRWLDLIDLFASKVDPTYELPRDEIQRDLGILADAIENYEARRG